MFKVGDLAGTPEGTLVTITEVFKGVYGREMCNAIPADYDDVSWLKPLSYFEDELLPVID